MVFNPQTQPIQQNQVAGLTARIGQSKVFLMIKNNSNSPVVKVDRN